MAYEPRSVPQFIEQVPNFLQDEFYRIASALMTDDRYEEAQLVDKNSVINTRLKGEGVRVWDGTLKKPVWATGKNPTDTWVDGAGTVVYSPV